MVQIEEAKAEIVAAGDLAMWELARRDFRQFLKYVKVYEKPPGRGVIDFEFWPHLEEMIDSCLQDVLAVWMKSRRIGASWLIAAYINFRAQQRGGYFPLASQGETEAIELLSKVRFVWSHLPAELQWGPLTTDSRTELKWGVDGSHVQAMPSTKNASRGSPITVGVIDEADFHEYLEGYYYAVKPSVDDSGAQLLIISTVNYDTQTSLFKETWRQAPGNGFKPHFWGWRVRPGRDEAWYGERRAEYPDKARFEKEFPETPQQALAAPKTLAAFASEILDQMDADTKPPVETRSGVLHIFQRFYPGKRYIAFTDTSHGVGADDAVTALMDVGTGYIVADIQSAVLSPEALAIRSVELLALYQNPLWGIEDNDWGRVTVEKAQALKYNRLYYRSEGQVGFHTNEGNRLNLWENLVSAIYDRLITVPSKEGLGQFYSIIRNPKKEGRIEAQAGAKDDYPFAVGGCWALRHRAFASRADPTDPLAVFRERRQGSAGLVRWSGG